jgi:hypothetical protein
LADGAPLVPGFLIFSSEPALMRLRFAWIFAYSPLLGTFLALLLGSATWHYDLLDLVPEHFQRLRDNRSGELGSFAAFGCFFI